MPTARLATALRTAVTVAGCTYVAVVAALFFGQRRLLFPAPRSEAPPAVSFAETFHGRRGGVAYLGLHRPARSADDLTYVYLHGNGEVVEGSAELFARLGDGREGMAALEYAGYGALHDEPLGEWPMLASVDAGLHALYARGVRPDRVVFIGRSLGSGFAVAMAARGHGIGLVLVSPFTSIPDVAARRYPFAPVRWLARDRFDSASRAPSVRVPTLVLHGNRDDLVPIALGRALAGRFPSARFVELDGAGHHDVFVFPGTDALQEAFAFGGQALAAEHAREHAGGR